jgi:membrane protein
MSVGGSPASSGALLSGRILEIPEESWKFASMRVMVRRTTEHLGELLLEIGKRWWRHGHSRSAAAIAFYSLFSMVPMLVIVTGLASAFIGKTQAEEGISLAAEVLFDEQSGEYLAELLKTRPDQAFTGISSVVGFLILLFTASKMVVELRESLGVIFGYRAREGRHGVIIDLVMGQVIPLLLVFALGAVLVVSALAAAVLQVITGHLTDYLPANWVLWEWGQRLVPLLIEVLLFAAVLKWLPPRPPRFISALSGAVVTCVLLVMLRSLIGFYFSQSSVTTAYGAAVTLVVILLWIYFTIQIFFIGAELAGYIERKRELRTKQEIS